ncbi:hypothetical protein C1H46_037273 [Malus baccata]|uniref:Uncharacterized protein n=1 Tax=Malus baccata TaxID=106549 RepID=A0A540KSR8_MALBA|nr:hypothetical protein C1H46_037273 [Malus baccata]
MAKRKLTPLNPIPNRTLLLRCLLISMPWLWFLLHPILFPPFSPHPPPKIPLPTIDSTATMRSTTTQLCGFDMDAANLRRQGIRIADDRAWRGRGGQDW